MMPVQASCPSCHTTYHIPDAVVGKPIRCKNCQHVFMVSRPQRAENPGRTRSAEPVDDDLPPRRRDRRASRAGHGALLWVLAGVVLAGLFLFMVAAAVLAWWLFSTPKPASPPRMASAPPAEQVEPGPLVVQGEEKKTEKQPGVPAEEKPQPPIQVKPPDRVPPNRPEPEPPNRVKPPDRVPPDNPPVPPGNANVLTLQPVATWPPQVNNQLKAIAFADDGKVLVAGGSGGLRRWNVRTRVELPRLTGQSFALAISPDGNVVAAGGISKTIQLWNVNTGAPLHKLNTLGRALYVHDLAFSPDGKFLAVADGLPMRLLPLAGGQPWLLNSREKTFLDSVSFSPDGNTVVAAGKTILRWEVGTRKELPSLTGHRGNVWRVCYSHDGKILASGGSDTTVKLWNPATGQVLHTLKDHAGPISALAFSPNDEVLVTGAGGVRANPSDDPDVRVWNARRGTLLARLKGHTRGINGVAVAPDGVSVAATATDGSVRLWDISTALGKPGTQVAVNPNPKPPVRPPVRPPITPPVRPPIRRPGRSPFPPPTLPAAPAASLAETVKKLPGTVEGVAAGGGGRFLALTLPSNRNVAVFDIVKGEVVKYLPMPEANVFVACCQDKLIVVVPEANLIQRYSLETFERELTVSMPVNAGVKQILMGSASRGPLVVFTGGGRIGGGGILLLDPYTLKQLPARGPARGGSVWRISGDGRVLTSYQPNLSPQGHAIHVFNGKGFKTYGLGDLNFAGQMSPGPEGRYIYTARGLFTSEGKPIGKRGSYSDGSRYCLPAAEGEAFYLNIVVPDFPHGSDRKSGTVYLHLAGDDRPVAKLDGVGVPTGLNTWGRERFGHDLRYYLVPSAKRLVYLPPTQDRLEVYTVDVDALLARCPHDYLVVLSQPPREVKRGQTLEYTPVVKSKRGGVKVTLEAGPAGMEISKEGKLTWNVPRTYPGREESIILSIRDAGGQEAFHTFRLAISNP
jgi:predicted Zn finger-like uncharacterized protein